MHSVTTRIGAAASALLFAGLLAAPAALADASCTISDNGARSRNRCKVRINHTTATSSVNNSSVSNSISITSKTGGNRANNNTGGSVSIDTGNSNVTVTITNNVNQ